MYIAVRGHVPTDQPPASNAARLYRSESAAWAWLRERSGEVTVFEIDLDEAVIVSEEPIGAQARYEHAERQATRYLGIMERLRPHVASGTKPSGDDVWKLSARSLAGLVRVFSGWRRLKGERIERPLATGDGIEVIADRALFEALTELLAPVNPADLINAETPPVLR